MLDAKTIEQKLKEHPNFKELKTCCTCKEIKHYSNFYLHKRETKAGYRQDYECKLCKKKKSRATKWKTKFGVTEQEVFSQYEKQGKKCAICKKQLLPPSFGTTSKNSFVFHIDHCHSTGKFRGLLCHFCNAGLGQFKDNPEYLKEALEYLSK